MAVTGLALYSCRHGALNLLSSVGLYGSRLFLVTVLLIEYHIYSWKFVILCLSIIGTLGCHLCFIFLCAIATTFVSH